MENLGKWLFWLGALLAVVGAFVAMDILGLLLVLVGLVIGALRWNKAMDQGFILAGLGLAASNAALGAIPAVGGYITAIAGGLWAMVGAALLVVVIKGLWDWGNM
jgi:hypothetical protein